MKRALTTLAVAAAGTLMVSAPAHAQEVKAQRVLDSIYSSLGMGEPATEVETSRSGFFMGIHSGLSMESGIAPASAGLSIPLNFDDRPASITANGYYVYTTDFSLGTYVGGGFGKFNLINDPLMNGSIPSGTLAYQGIAGVTYSFTPSMVLGLEYRYSENVDSNNFSQTTVPGDEEAQSVTLRFDFLLN